MSGSSRKPNPELPDELVVMELVTRLPGKQVARCKCVCKLWRSMIGSARFKDVYGSCHRGLICYWVHLDDKVRESFLKADTGLNHLSFSYSPIRGLKDPEVRKFDCLYQLRISRHIPLKMTQVVNGLLCVDHGTAGLILYNVCTGERMRMRIPDSYVIFSIHLGYDPSTRVYKLLRLIRESNHPVQALIISLTPSSTWRELSGIPRGIRINWSYENRVSPTDRFLCWHWSASTRPLSMEGLVLFDIGKEKFHKVCLPRECCSLRLNEMCVRAQFMEHDKRLAVTLWCISQRVYIRNPLRDFACFVMRDDEGKAWSKHGLEFPTMMNQKDAVLVAANWDSYCEMVLMDKRGSKKVYCYGGGHTMTRFQVGRIPTTSEHGTDGIRALGGIKGLWYCSTEHRLVATPSYLFDANNLYLPLHAILGA